MAIAWRPLLPLLIVSALIFHEDWLSTPSCKTLPGEPITDTQHHLDENDDLKVMIVADLLLAGSEARFIDLLFRDYYMSKFFRKSFQSLKPDMLLVLGDVSARGWELSATKWLSVVDQFHRMLGPFLGLPLHVVLGDRDIGECGKLNARSVDWISGRFPGLDSGGCGAFEIGNVSFVSLNSVALLCGSNDLRFSIERVIESESLDLATEFESIKEGMDESSKIKETIREFGWRDDAIPSGSGPVLLLHFPLRQMATPNCDRSSKTLGGRWFVGTGPYKLLQSLPPNATEYIFQALKPSVLSNQQGHLRLILLLLYASMPEVIDQGDILLLKVESRIIFSAHTHEFSSYFHPDGTREVTVPALTWNARDDPGFIVANFRRNNIAVSISYCSLVRESRLIMGYVYVMVLFVVMMVFSRRLLLICSRQ
ncbi:hypothetical protein FEM48_Zijuj06G0117900 [Ziziphus jujuba var. spinosa]|uniref:Metallophosphoesterase 1-like n=1 Tax=Ziziphus jujuba var. spinosa TaxID=714518 RepID=A0A978V941_ZIZJJ|nr:hypothetical protein FEM48_Zijuj06G0117900 [Ziziphus jujuba var. spinosa]